MRRKQFIGFPVRLLTIWLILMLGVLQPLAVVLAETADGAGTSNTASSTSLTGTALAPTADPAAPVSTEGSAPMTGSITTTAPTAGSAMGSSGATAFPAAGAGDRNAAQSTAGDALSSPATNAAPDADSINAPVDPAGTAAQVDPNNKDQAGPTIDLPDAKKLPTVQGAGSNQNPKPLNGQLSPLPPTLPFLAPQTPKATKPSIDQSSGALGYNYAFAFPPGKNGLTPQLALQYNSQNSEEVSMVGYGWKINIPSIERINLHGSDKLYVSKDFSASVSGELTEVSADVYAPKTDQGDFLTYSFQNNSFVAKTKDGLIYTYGESGAARQDDPVDATKVYQWSLSKIADSLGNTIDYKYLKINGALYPDTITYGGTANTQGIYQIKFSWQDNASSTVSYKTAFAVRNSKLLQKIDLAVSGNVARSWNLAYNQSPNNNRMLLQKIAETAGNQIKPDITFSYQKHPLSWTENANYKAPSVVVHPNNEHGIEFFDANGDALPDIVSSEMYYQPNCCWIKSTQVQFNNGNGWDAPKQVQVPVPLAVFSAFSDIAKENGVRVGDFNGDMLADLIQGGGTAPGAGAAVYLNNGNNWTKNGADVPIGFSGDGADAGTRMADINGDGLPDLVYAASSGYGPDELNNNSIVYTNENAQFVKNNTWLLPNFTPTLGQSPGFPQEDIGTRLVDINHDGLTDLIRYNFTNNGPYQYIYLNNGHGWVKDAGFPGSALPVNFVNNNPCFCVPNDNSVRIYDANGDGLQDIIGSTVNADTNFNVSGTIFLNKGTGGPFQQVPNSPVGFLDATLSHDRGGRTADVNGDGIEDLIQAEDASYNPYINQHTHLADSTVPDLLSTVKLETGGTITVNYKASTQYRDNQNKLLNPHLPIIVQTVESITETEPFANISSTSHYLYEGGTYYFHNSFDRRFAGFEKVTIVRPDGSKIISYFHQGNETNAAFNEPTDHPSKIGMPYRQEIFDSQGKLFTRQTSVDDFTALPSTNNDRFYVYKIQDLTENFDGKPVAVASAQTYTYDKTNGNLIKTWDYGDVTVTAPNQFSDVGDDSHRTDFYYATDNAGQYQPSIVYRYGGPNFATIMAADQYFYDNLPTGKLSNGLLTEHQRWYDSQHYQSQKFAYDATGFLINSTDPFGHVTTYTPDTSKLFTAQITNPLNQKLAFTYNYAAGQIATSTGYNNYITTYNYDGFGRITSITFNGFAAAKNSILETRTYNDSPDLPNKKPSSLTVTKYLQENQSNATTVLVDGLGRSIRTLQGNDDGSGCLISDQSYDQLGQLAKSALPFAGACQNSYSGFQAGANLQTAFSYDVLGRTISQKNILGTTTWQYDGRKTTITDVLGKKKTLSSDGLSRLIKVTEYLTDKSYDTLYTYDATDNLTQITDAAGNIRNFTYDLLGNRLTATDLHAPNDALYGTTTETYIKGMLKSSTTKPSGMLINYFYDDLYRLVSKTNNNTTLESYSYDNCANGVGHLCSIANATTQEDYGYDAAGRVKSTTLTTDQQTFSTWYFYDFAGNLLSEVHPNNELTAYTYTSRGLPATVKYADQLLASATYNELGKPAVIQYANGKTTTYTYDPTKLFQLSNLKTPGLQDTDYSFDAAGNLLNEIENSPNNPYSGQYSYDDLYRLTSTKIVENNQTTSRNYSYDILGNILSGPMGTYLYEGSASQQNGLSYANPHAVTQLGDSKMQYSIDGNVLSYLTSAGTFTYSHDDNNEITTVKLDNKTVADYRYTTAGRRVAKYTQEGANPPGGGVLYSPTKEYDVDGSGLVTVRIFLGSQEVASSEKSPPDDQNPQGGKPIVRYLHPDYLGSTRVITDQQGQLVQTLYYHAFGEVRYNQEVGTFNEKRKFTGHIHDNETELDYMEARYYNATWGRFLSQDPVFLGLGGSAANAALSKFLLDPQSLNSYAYARNNPLRYTDPTGMASCDLGCFLNNAESNLHAFGEGLGGSSYSGDGSTAAYIAGSVAHAAMGTAEIISGGMIGGGGAALTGQGAFACATGGGCVEGAPAMAIGTAAVEVGVATMKDGVAKIQKGAGNIMNAVGNDEKTEPTNSAAKLSSNGLKLSKQLASEAQMAEKGETIINSDKLRDSWRLAKQYGGQAMDWVKKSSSSYTAQDGAKLETHWFENAVNGVKAEFKTKLTK